MSFLRSWAALSLLGSLTAFVSFFLFPIYASGMNFVTGWGILDASLAAIVNPATIHSSHTIPIPSIIYLYVLIATCGLLFMAGITLFLCIGITFSLFPAYFTGFQRLSAAIGIILPFLILLYGFVNHYWGAWGSWLMFFGFLASFANPRFVVSDTPHTTN